MLLMASMLWEHVEVVHLSTNMRVHLYADAQAGTFADVLLRVGEGKVPIISAVDCIWIPPGGVTETLDELKAAVLAIYPFIFRMQSGCVKEQSLLRKMILLHM